MTGREKVIKGLEQFIADFKPFCGNKADWQRVYDALALLKAQEPIKPRVEFNLAGQPMWCCGKCGTTLFFKFCQMMDDEDKRNEHRFCHYCGQAVKWE